MKKTIYLLTFFFAAVLFSFPLFGQDKSTYYFDSSKKLISLSLEENSELLTEISYRLDYSQREQLYDMYSISSLSATLQNGFLGFGSGSDRQGDETGAKIARYLEVGGLGIAFGVTVFNVFFMNSDTDTSGQIKNNVSIIGYLTAAGVFLGGRIFSIIRPAVYAGNHNNLLKTTLRLDENQVAFAPVVNPYSNEFGFAVQMKL